MCKMCLCVFILITIVTSSPLASHNGIFPCGSRLGAGNNEEYKCQIKMDCILKEQICNGFQDCPDGSDEAYCPYHKEGSELQAHPGLNRSKRQSTCDYGFWQCGEAHCISQSKLCDGFADCNDSSDEASVLCNNASTASSGACILPPYPEHGTYKVAHFPNARPGQPLATFLLTVRCRRGYGVVDPYGDGSGTKQVYCVYGEWYQKMPRCVRFCKLDPDPSVNYMCYLPGTRVEVCKNYVPPGTLVDPVCNSPLYYSTEVFTNMKCISGFWNYIALCKAECGRIAPGGSLLIIGGQRAKRGELPWHAGIYRKTTQPYVQICSGSLVSNNVVISAAHCFWKASRKILPPSEFGVAIGKIIRSWDSEEDVDAQKSDVKEIKIPNLFQGADANFQEDIAVLILTTPFNYTTYIRPVCLNFNPNFDSWQLQHGKLGKVAGWGLTAANGKASETLTVIEIPSIDIETCISTLPDTFREYITSDKFCAGYVTGSALCQGDSGGGLAFSDKELGIDRYYLRGVVSAAPNEIDKMCNDNTYTTFTKITKHQEFIKEALTASVPNACPLYSFQCADGSCVDRGADCNGRRDCEDGSDESEEYCLVGTTPAITFQQQVTEEPEVESSTLQTIHQNLSLSQEPTSTAIILDVTQKPVQSSLKSNSNCGLGFGNSTKDTQTLSYDGHSYVPWLAAIYTIDTSNISEVPVFLCGGTLISDRHIVTVASLVQQISVHTMKAVLGGNLKNWSNKSSIIRSVISNSVLANSVKFTFENDISVLTLNERVEFSTYIQPACLRNSKIDISRRFNVFGVFAGWGEAGEVRSPYYLGDPHQLRMQLIRTDVCKLTKFDFLNLKTFICARDREGGNPYRGDTGGGLYIVDEDKWTLRGIFSAFSTNLNGYIVFTDVAPHLPWIRNILQK